MSCKIHIDKVKTGEKLRIVIAKSGTTYEKIAEILELNSSRVIYDWISGIKLPSTVNLLNLAIRLNFRIEDVLVIENSFLFLNHRFIVSQIQLIYNLII
jgi:transcriptional regulator with XRE-family HTH domain